MNGLQELMVHLIGAALAIPSIFDAIHQYKEYGGAKGVSGLSIFFIVIGVTFLSL